MRYILILILYAVGIQQLFSQQNAIYSLKIDYSYKRVIDCESCETNSKNYGYVGLNDGNGSPFIQLYTTEDISVDLAFWETWTYDSFDGWNGVNYCSGGYSSLDEFLNMNVNYCEARRNVETAMVTLGNSVEYGNTNSENLGSLNAGSYVKSWLLPYEPEGDIISVSYCETIFEREGVQVEDGFWEYLVDGNQDWLPVKDENYKHLYPLSISVEDLDAILPVDLKSNGNIQLKFTIFGSGSGSWSLWDMEYNDNPPPTITPGYKEKNFLYPVELSSCSIELDPNIQDNLLTSGVKCSDGSDGGVTAIFERELQNDESLTINLTKDLNEDGVFDEDPFAEFDGLTSSDFEGTSYTIENQLKSGDYQMEWGLSSNNNFVWSEEPVEFYIPEPQPITFNLNKIEPTCSGIPDGEITVANLNGGNGDYAFDWKRNGESFELPEGSTNTHLVHLPEGMYSLLVTDILGCESEVEEIELVAVAESPQLDAYLIFQPGEPPNFLPTGSIVLEQLSGGDGNYTYHWTKDGEDFLPNDPTNLQDLESGDYTLVITDDGGQGCPSEDYGFIINELPPLEISIAENVSITCEGDIGILEANPIGGTNGGYEYLWSTGETTKSIEVGQGSYSVTVTDNANSIQEAFYEFDYINPLLKVEIIQNNSICKGEDFGSIQLNISGGTGGPYEISWLDDPVTDAFRENLSIGEYVYFVTDGECQVTNEDSPIVMTEPNVGIKAVEISKTNISINAAEDGTLAIEVLNGISPFTYNWTKDGEPFGLSPQSTNTELVGLGEGSYQVVVMDANGCSASLEEPIIIFEPEPLEIVELAPAHINCKGDASGSITANVTGIPPFTYVWEKQGEVNFSAPNEPTITGLGPGTYILSLSDNSIVPEVVDSVVLTEPSEVLGANVVPFPTVCFIGEEGTIDITAFGGTPPYIYSIDGGLSFQGGDTFSNLQADNYQIVIVDDSGCELLIETTVGLPDQIRAEFAMASQAFVDENIIAVDLSHPLPDTVEWSVPEGVIVTQQNNDELGLTFTEPGEYEIGITVYKKECWSTLTKRILVLENSLNGTVDESEVTLREGIERFVIYPNPTTGQFYADIGLTENGSVSLKVFGFANNNLILQELMGGGEDYNIPMNIEGLPSGIYVVVLETPMGNSLRKLILR
ncbi:MAG: hypothetical protein AAF348_13920 [Bacteroidota bacterium]